MITKKKLKLILLPTQNKATSKDICLNTSYGPGLTLPMVRGFNELPGTPNKHLEVQHLYAISDEKPRVGDYVYNSALNVIEKFTEFDNGLLQNKVVITTDESLVIRYDERYVDVTLSGKSLNGKLPNFTNNFIEAYITRYNSGQALEYINVEYEEFHSYNMCSIPEKHNSCRIFKVNSDNTLDVSLIENKLYTKEEVVNFFSNYQYYLAQYILSNEPPENRLIPVEWINKNL